MNAILRTFYIWIITCIAGPLIIAAIFTINGERHATEIAGIFALFAGVCSIPGMIVYHFVALAISRQSSSKAIHRLKLSAIAILIVFLSAVTLPRIIFRTIPSSMELAVLILLTYGPPFILSILLFDHTSSTEQDQNEEKDQEAVTSSRTLKAYMVLITACTAVPYLQTLSNLLSLLNIGSRLSAGYTVYFIIYLVAVPVAWLLFWKNKKPGWILLFYFPASYIISSLSAFFSHYFPSFDYLLKILFICLNVVTLVLLNSRIVYRRFMLNGNTRLVTAVSSVIIATCVFLLFN